MDENIRTLTPDEIIKPVARFILDIGCTKRAIVLDKTNLIILENYEYRSYGYERNHM